MRVFVNGTKYQELLMAAFGDAHNSFGYESFEEWAKAFGVADGYEEAIDSLLSEWTNSCSYSRYAKTLRFRFGFLDGKYDRSLQATAKMLGVTKERARQITAKGLRIFRRHFSLKTGILERKESNYQNWLAELSYSDADDIFVLDMSVRTTAVLRTKYQVETVGKLKELSPKTEEELVIMMPYLGRMGAKELRSVLSVIAG